MAFERLTLEDIFLKLTTPGIKTEDVSEDKGFAVEDTDEEPLEEYIPQFSHANDSEKEDEQA